MKRDLCSEGEPILTREFEPDDGKPPSRVLCEALGDIEGCDPLELPPLYETIDLEALDQLFGPIDTDSGRVLQFPYEEWIVTIRGNHSIDIYPT